MSSYSRLPTSSSSFPPVLSSSPRKRRFLPLACALLAVVTLLLPLVSYGTDWSPSLISNPFHLSNRPKEDVSPPEADPDAPPYRPPGKLPGPPHHRLSTKTGLLRVDLRMPVMDHPIYTLLQQARREWDAKVARQSRTLEQAVKEYKRRNGGRNPPKGFGHWWAFVVKNKVPLPDEYDRIMTDLLPYRGLSAATLHERMAFVRNTMRETFSLSCKDGVLKRHSQTYDSTVGGEAERDMAQYDLVKDVQQWLPDFDAVFSINDSPRSMVAWKHMQELKELVEKGEVHDGKTEADRSLKGWGAACPPDSPLYERSLSSLKSAFHSETLHLGPAPLIPPGAPKSFIGTDHGKAMDLCWNPDVVDIHGTTVGLVPDAQPHLMPFFSISKTNLHSDILTIPTEQWGKDYGAFSWKDHDLSKLFWRGRNTGSYFSNTTAWRSSHRARLGQLASDSLTNRIDIIPHHHLRKLFHSLEGDSDDAGASEAAEEEASGGERRRRRQGGRRGDDEVEEKEAKEPLSDIVVTVQQGKANAKMLDVGLAYEPVQCEEADGTCERIKEELTYRPVKTFEDENHYKFILDVDGNAWSARFKRLLNSRAVIFKSTIFPEWWNERIQPWLHYIPIKVDYSDLYDIAAFFQAEAGEEEVAHKIAEAGREWSLTHWRQEDMTAYMFRLYLEWARILADDREAMDFVLGQEVEEGEDPAEKAASSSPAAAGGAKAPAAGDAVQR